MTTWVLPGILKADDVLDIPLDMLIEMSNMSTGIILNYVNKFISGNINSSDETMAAAAKKMSIAYENVNKVNDYLNSEEAKTLSDTLCSLEYRDVSAEMPLEKLTVMRAAILELLAEDVDFVQAYAKEISESSTRGMKTAYTVKLDEDNFIRILDAMRVVNRKEHTLAGDNLIGCIERNTNLFKNSRAKLNAPTVMRKAIYRKDKLKTILRGIDYLIDKKQSGAPPISWRRV